MMPKKLLFPALVFACYAPLSLACTKPEAPELPDPETAVTPQMVKAQNDMKAYIDAANAFLKCNRNSAHHNSMVDQMESHATKFNGIVRAYKTRMGS